MMLYFCVLLTIVLMFYAGLVLVNGRWLLPAAVLLLVSAGGEPAEACHRCGLFGNKCRFATYYYPQAYYTNTYPVTNNYVFNSTYPQPILPQQGNTVYGYSMLQQSYNINPAQVLDRSSRFTELSQLNAGKALTEFNTTVNGALALQAEADRHQRNTAMVMAALQPAYTAPQSFSFRVTTNSRGEMRVENVDSNGQLYGNQTCGPNGCTTPEQRSDTNVPPLSLEICAKCHDGQGTKGTPLTFVFRPGEQISRELYNKSAKAVMAGRMPPLPPNQRWSEDTKLEFIGEMAKSVQ